MAFVTRPGRIDLRVPIVLAFDGVRVTRETRNIGLGECACAYRRLIEDRIAAVRRG